MHTDLKRLSSSACDAGVVAPVPLTVAQGIGNHALDNSHRPREPRFAMPKATYDDLIRVPDDKIAELVGGELNASPRPRVRHSHAMLKLSRALDSEFGQGSAGRGGWWLLIEPEVHLGEDVFVPDIVGWRTSTLPRLPDEPWIETVPDWVCEVLSPSTQDWDAGVKLPAYARYGVPFAWLVDPGTRVFRSFARRDGAFELVDTWTGNATVSTVPFEDFALDLSGIWLS